MGNKQDNKSCSAQTVTYLPTKLDSSREGIDETGLTPVDGGAMGIWMYIWICAPGETSG